MLTIENCFILDSTGKKINLCGVNLGGWLMMEGYILYGRNIPERGFKEEFRQHYGKNGLDDFTVLFRNNFIREEDFKNISRIGFNCIRLPFNHKLIENQDARFSINKEGLRFLKRIVSICKKYNIYCILDMHAAPGSQNEDWHSDSDGKALLWKDKTYRERFYRLWEVIADTFKDEDNVAGYNILNEPVIKNNGRAILRPFYKETVRSIRAIDKHHIIFLDGNLWAQRLEDIGEPFSDNLSYSIHYYQPLEFTFNFVKDLRYPGKMYGRYWDIDTIRKSLGVYYDYSKKWKVPIFLGEFGVNSRCGACFGENEWVRDVLRCCREFGFHWTYWTYKAVRGDIFPDGLYQYKENPPWINRQGPVYGWENFYTLWQDNKEKIVESWRTKNFIENKELVNLLASFIPI